MDKELEKMEQSQLDLLFPVKISVYDEKWPELYLSEKSLIEKALGDEVLFRIRHFGSTSVPGLCAKPTIDILAEVNDTVDLEYIIKAFREIGYNYAFQPLKSCTSHDVHEGIYLKGIFRTGISRSREISRRLGRDIFQRLPHIASGSGTRI